MIIWCFSAVILYAEMKASWIVSVVLAMQGLSAVMEGGFEILTWSGLGSMAAYGSEAQDRLIKDLFQGYDKMSRPVNNLNETVEVLFGLTLNILVYVVSERREIFSKPCKILPGGKIFDEGANLEIPPLNRWFLYS